VQVRRKFSSSPTDYSLSSLSPPPLTETARHASDLRVFPHRHLFFPSSKNPKPGRVRRPTSIALSLNFRLQRDVSLAFSFPLTKNELRAQRGQIYSPRSLPPGPQSSRCLLRTPIAPIRVSTRISVRPSISLFPNRF